MQFGRRRAILPIDSVSGGTWIAVNDGGLAMTILNANPTAQPMGGKSSRLSRGTIIPSLLHCDGMPQALEFAAELKPADFPPFRLVLLNRSELAEWRSDGTRLELVTQQPVAAPVMFTSSGLGDDLVEGPRRKLFEETLRHADDWVAEQEAFHRHQWPDRPHLSVRMRRQDARTVSHTVVTLSENAVSMSYFPVDADQAARPVALSIEMSRLHGGEK